MRILIRKAKVVDPQSGYHNKVTDLFIENGIITRIAGTIKDSADTVIEAKGMCVSPGWVDVFADYCEPGYEHKETISSGLATAAAGGFTDVLLLPNTQPAVANQAAVQYVLQRARGNAVSLHPMGAVTRNLEGKELAEMLDMRTNGALAFTDGWKPVQQVNLLLKALEYVSAFDGVIVQMPIEASLAGGLMHEGPVSTALGMQGIPSLAETLMVFREIELARYTGAHIHLTAISAAESVAMIRAAKAEGLKVSCSVTPYHLLLTDEVMRGYSSHYKVSPPLRSEADRQALIAGLADGTIDCIATHHHPQDWDAKEKELDYASSGMAIQQYAYQLMCQALGDSVSEDVLIAALTSNPRTIFGLPARTIDKGAIASLTLFSPVASTAVNAANKKSASYNNPFVGQTLSGAVAGIVNNNQVILNK